MRQSSRKTPKDATEFEREQLRFFLTSRNAGTILAEVNPSLAWLPTLAEFGLIETDTPLAAWIEKNFSDEDAIREIAANIHFFGPDTADILEFRLNRAQELRPLLLKCWHLIIRHMRTVGQSTLRGGWFDIAPRVERGDHSPELIERIASVLQPKLRVSGQTLWRDEESNRQAAHPTDLITINYEVDDNVTAEDVLSAWPKNAPADADRRLLRSLTQALHQALEDATEAGVEGESRYRASDFDVQSVAEHAQNAHRRGYLPIVRVMADIWTRLTQKETEHALEFIELWRTNQYPLIRRLALFAAADQAVPAITAAQILRQLPAGELFLTNSSVEVYRLIEARWLDISADDRVAIEERIADGPPKDRIGEDDKDIVDYYRFDLLGHIDRAGAQLGNKARAVFDEIRRQQPEWEIRPKERAGFHIWHSGSSAIVGDPTKLSDVPDAQLVTAAEAIAAEASMIDGDAWRALCQTDTQRAFRGLSAKADAGQWPAWAWHSFLWVTPNLEDTESITSIAQLLLLWPKDQFHEISSDASWWLNQVARLLGDDLLWPLWDRIIEATPQNQQEVPIDDALTASLNDRSGRLVEIALSRLTKDASNTDYCEAICNRLMKLVDATGALGFLARVRLAAEVSLLFERVPNWTKKHIIPLFDWTSPEASAAWEARMYTRYIGSPELFELTKQPFLELFERDGVSEEELRVFADWLVAIAISNQGDGPKYPFTHAEVRSALRRLEPKTLSSVGHRLATEMENTKPGEKIRKWREVVGPIFQSVWPLDVDLQTSATTFKLVQILRASGPAFGEAAEVIIPYIRAEDSNSHTSLYSVSNADDELYSSFPDVMLDLVSAVVGDKPTRLPYGLNTSLNRITEHAPHLVETKRFQRLLGIVNRI